MAVKNIEDLSVAVSRSHASYDRQGNTVAANLPRYTEVTSNQITPKWVNSNTVGGLVKGLGSQFDHDGVTPLIILQNRSSGDIKIYRQSTDFSDPVLTRNILRDVSGTNYSDILKSTDIEDASHVYSPVAGTICHGLIVLQCLKRRTSDQEIISIAIVTLQASSSTTTDWFDSGQIVLAGALPTLGGGSTYDDYTRSEEWSLSNYFPDRKSTTLLGAWIPFVDYVHNVTAGQQSPGGQVGLTYVSRDAIGSQWDVGAVKLIYDSVVTEGAVSGNHFHSAGCFQHDEKNLTVVWFEGDSTAINVVRSTDLTDATDIRANYNSVTPTSPVDIHGNKGGSNPFKGSQCVGCCPSTVYGDLLTTVDEGDCAIISLTVPEVGVTDVIDMRRVYGKVEASVDTGTSINQNSLWIHNPTPENFSGAIARAYNGSSNSATYDDAGRILYSPDGLNWGILGKYPASVGNRAIPFISGSRAFITNFSVSDNIYSCDIPDMKAARGIQIRSGYTQEMRTKLDDDNDYYWNENGTNTITPLSKNTSGQYVNPITGAEIPAPPCASPVLRLTSSVGYFKSGTLRLTNNESLSHLIGTTALVWVYPLQHSFSSRLQHGGDLGYAGSLNYTAQSNAGWIPIISTGTPEDETGTWYLRLNVFTESGAGAKSDYLLAVGEVSQSGRMSGTPVASTLRRGDATVLTSDDEQCEITGFALGSQWSIAMSLRVPEECWDSTVADEMSTGIEPLVSLRVDDNNYIYVYADLVNDRLITEAKSDGTTSTLTMSSVKFYRIDPIQLGISSLGGISIAAVVGGHRGGETTLTGSIPKSIKPTSIRMGSPDWSTVSQIDLFDVVVNENEAYSSENLINLISNSDIADIPDYITGNHGTFS